MILFDSFEYELRLDDFKEFLLFFIVKLISLIIELSFGKSNVDAKRLVFVELLMCYEQFVELLVFAEEKVD